MLKATTWRVFEIYNNQAGPDGFNQSFSSWLSSTSYQDQIATGKSKSVSSAHFSNYLKMLNISSFLYRLEWERKIPDDKISALKDLMNCDKFDDNLPEVINQINQLSYKTFSDLPRGENTRNKDSLELFMRMLRNALL